MAAFRAKPGRPVGGTNGINTAMIRYAQNRGLVNRAWGEPTLHEEHRIPIARHQTLDAETETVREAMHQWAAYRQNMSHIRAERDWTAPRWTDKRDLPNHRWNGLGEYAVSPIPYARVPYQHN
jgi:hypothetical protein